MNKKVFKSKCKIMNIGVTNDTLTGRGGANVLRMTAKYAAAERRDVSRLLCAADTSLLTSVSEGTPLTIIEAMAARVPVVATDVAGIPEMVSDAVSGRLAEAGDHVQVEDCIQSLAVDAELRASIGGAGSEVAHSTFSQKQMIDQYVTIYEEMCGGGL